MHLVQMHRCEGKNDIPVLEAESIVPSSLVAFHEAMKTKRKNCGVHFFIDDYRFERVWNDPKRYLAVLENFECVLTPDFTLYTDMPKALKIYNVYRNRLIGQYFQRNGVRVIPTVSWADADSFSYCFAGIPAQATVAVSNLGIGKSPMALATWHAGMDEMLRQLAPAQILFYGCRPPMERDYGTAQVTFYKNETIERMEEG